MKRKRIWKTGDIAYVIIRSMTPPKARRIGTYETFEVGKQSPVTIEFWTGTTFVRGGTAAYQEAKLYKTRKIAEDDAAQMILVNPIQLFGDLEVIEQVVWKDLWA